MRIIIAMIVVAILSGCAGKIDGSKYSAITPTLELEAFFNGDVKAWGIVQDRSGNVVQRFKVDIAGRIEGTKIILDETFHYGLGDGVKHRIWTINKTGASTYSGTANDINDKAVGSAFGNAVRWSYTMDLPVGKRAYKLMFDDWLWAFDENTLINRSYIKKFGLVMAEVTIFMQKVSP